MRACARCMNVPQVPQSAGTLFLAPPLAHTEGTLRKVLKDQGVAFEEPVTRVTSIVLKPGLLESLITTLSESLSEGERRDTRTLLLAEGLQPSLGDLADMQPLSALVATIQEKWLIELIQDQRLTTHFQPIVRADSPEQVYAYECLLRGVMPDGSLVSPTRMYDSARDAELLFQLDRVARLTAIREAVTQKIGANLFINFNPSSIYDPAFCLKSTIAAIEDSEIEPDRITFEVVESDHVNVDLLGIMRTYQKAGFRVALDDLGAGYGSLNLLTSLQPDVVKLDMRLIRDVDREPYKAEITSKLLEMAQKLGIKTVAEGIETQGEFDWFRDRGADYLQGYFIARPGNPPPQPFAHVKCSTHYAVLESAILAQQPVT